CSRSADRSRTGGPPHARSGPQCEPHAAPSNRDSRPSSPAPCRLKAKGYLLPEFYSGATGRSGRFNEGLLLRRLHLVSEGLDQLDLLVCEWLDSGAQQDNDADRDALAKQRNAKHRAEVADALMIDESELVEV